MRRSTVASLARLAAFLFGSATAQSTVSWRNAHALPTSAVHAAKPATTTGSVYAAFDVYPPVLTVDDANKLIATNADPEAPEKVVASSVTSCSQTLAVHSFANSYGAPYVGTYTPPSCDFNQVTWNLTVQTSGYQYDRTGSVSFNSTELYRTTTIEPDVNVTQWTYLKDMTPFLSLFSYEATIIFDLPNIIDDSIEITGDYNVTLTATYFTVESSYEPADLIYTISRDLGAEDMPSYFTFPQQNASSSITLPRNIKKAIYTVVAQNQADEEFFWASNLNSEVDTFPDDPSYGYSPFREVQVYIDGSLAGVAWPFILLFSGADDPLLWRPVGGIDILDLKEYEIDITPWLPLLCDGDAHTFDMVVSGINNTGTGNPAVLSETTMDDWFVGGKIFVWLDVEGHVTTGTGPHITGLAPTLDVSSHYKANATGANTTLRFEVEASRNLAYTSKIKLSTGVEHVSWSQNLSYSATADITQEGNVETLTIDNTGYEVSSSGYARDYSYPFYFDGTETYLDFSRSKDVTILGQSVFPTGLDTFFSNTTGKGSVSNIAQTAIYNDGTVTATTNLTFSATDATLSTGKKDVKATQLLFTQYTSALNSSLLYDEADFAAKPQIVL